MIWSPNGKNLPIFEDLRTLCKQDRSREAILKLALLHQQHFIAPSHIICSLLQSCIKKKDIAAGKQVQSLVLKAGLHQYESAVADHLIRFFTSCHSLQDADKTFDGLQKPTIYSWNAIISAHSKVGDGERALQLFGTMQSKEGIIPDKFTFLPALNACGNIATVCKGRYVHDLINRHGLEIDASIGNALVDMYVKCGSLEEGYRVFEMLPCRDLISWGTIIDGFTQHGCGLTALELFKSMQQEGQVPNRVIYSCVLKACGSIGALIEGRLVYSQILKSNIELDEGMANHLVDMYVRCRTLDEGVEALLSWPKRDTVSWSTLISGYVQHGDGSSALWVFEEMLEDGVGPDRVVYLSVLQACSTTGAIKQGQITHDLLIRGGLIADVVVASTLVDMYAKFQSFEEACNVLERMSHRDAVAWAMMISAYAQHEYGHSAIECYEKMQKDGVSPDGHIFSCTLKACGNVGALEHGRSMHKQIIKVGYEANSVVGSSVVDMYAKCGSLEEGWKSLNSMQSDDVVAWNALIAGFAQHCEYSMAQLCLQMMHSRGVRSDGTTYISVLAACSHAGNVEDGEWYFKSMRNEGVKLTMEHFNCMIDLYGRSGKLSDAVQLLNSMPILPNITGWTSLLATCQNHQDLQLGQLCFNHILQLDPHNAAGFMLISNLFADVGMWEDVAKLREMMMGIDT